MFQVAGGWRRNSNANLLPALEQLFLETGAVNLGSLSGIDAQTIPSDEQAARLLVASN